MPKDSIFVLKDSQKTSWDKQPVKQKWKVVLSHHPENKDNISDFVYFTA